MVILLCLVPAAATAGPVLINGTGIYITTDDAWDFYQGSVFEMTGVNFQEKQTWIKLRNSERIIMEDILSEDQAFIYSKNGSVIEHNSR